LARGDLATTASFTLRLQIGWQQATRFPFWLHRLGAGAKGACPPRLGVRGCSCHIRAPARRCCGCRKSEKNVAGRLENSLCSIERSTRRAGGDGSNSNRFFRVVGAKRQTEPFFERLQYLASIPESRRLTEVNGIPFWIDKLMVSDTEIRGRLCRSQSNNLPPQATRDGKLIPLGVGQIGPNVAWQYDDRYAVIGIETSRSGVSLRTMIPYIRIMCDCAGYGYCRFQLLKT
jgi:hypothetical protein